MTLMELERRVAALESQVKQLQSQCAASPDKRHNWEATVDEFKNDEHLFAVFAEAMKLREKERQRARRRRKNVDQ